VNEKQDQCGYILICLPVLWEKVTKLVLQVSELKANALLLKVKILPEKCITVLLSLYLLKLLRVFQLALQNIETLLDD
jgi:hypothetical protein